MASVLKSNIPKFIKKELIAASVVQDPHSSLVFSLNVKGASSQCSVDCCLGACP